MSNQQGGKPPGSGQPPHPAQPWPPAAHPGPAQPAPQAYPSPYAPPQPYPGQPYPGQPYPAQPYPSQPQPYPAQPYAPHGYAQQPYPQPAQQPHVAPPAGPAAEPLFTKSLGRALRLRIEPNEVSASEHAALVHANPPITDLHLGAFLAWRRSVLFLVALALVPLTALRLYDAFKDTWPEQLRFVPLLPAAAEGFLCIVCWVQLKNWMNWRKQRRAVFRAWLVFMAAPFLVFLIPMDEIIGDLVAKGGGGAEQVVVLKATIAIYALLTLAPKAVSLLAGTLRAGIVTKMLFPGTAGPGWIVVLVAPIYTLMVFTLLIVPYQLTGSGWYFGAMLALAGGQLALARAGFKLARPTTHEDAVQQVQKARAIYLFAMIGFGVCLLVALGAMVEQLGATTIVTTVLSFEANVLILTLIGSDLLITNLERARGLSSGTAHLADESNKRLSAFVGES